MGLGDADQRLSDPDRLPLLAVPAGNHPGAGRGDLYHRLVGLHLQQHLVLGDLLPFRHQPPAQLHLGNPFTQIGKLELERH